METGSICIRKAQPSDIDNIFWLLHSESIALNTEQINANLDCLHVMTCLGKLIGVACHNLVSGQIEFCWAAIHPMYPKKAMTSILYNSIMNISFNLSSAKLKLCY